MSSASPTSTINSIGNDLLKLNSSDMTQTDAYKASSNYAINLDSIHEIPMNLLPAGNCQKHFYFFINQKIFFEDKDFKSKKKYHFSIILIK